MKQKLKLFGFPLYYNLKRRVAKKHLKLWWGSHFSEMKGFYIWCKSLSTIGIGDLINECSGLNSRITKLEPSYSRVGNGYILVDVNIITDSTSCSAKHCGVDVQCSYEHAIEYRQHVVDDQSKWARMRIRYSKMEILADGTYKEDAPSKL